MPAAIAGFDPETGEGLFADLDPLRKDTPPGGDRLAVSLAPAPSLRAKAASIKSRLFSASHCAPLNAPLVSSPQVSASLIVRLGRARVLGATTVRRLSAGPWQTVAADEDWFLKARLPIPDDFRFSRLVSFPEQGQNCVRPEFLVAAFAEDVIVKAAHSEPIVLGAVSPTDELHAVLGRMAPWRRVIAFRGIKV